MLIDVSFCASVIDATVPVSARIKVDIGFESGRPVSAVAGATFGLCRAVVKLMVLCIKGMISDHEVVGIWSSDMIAWDIRRFLYQLFPLPHCSMGNMAV